MVDAAVTQRVVTLAADASWLLPIAGLTLIGFSEKGAPLLPLSNSSLVSVAVATAVPGLALGVASFLGSAGAARRRAIAGAAVSAVVLLVTGMGSVCGAVSGQRAQRELRVAIEAAVHDFPGWNGGTVVDGASLSAIEVDAHSELAKILLRPYDLDFRIVLLSVDNRRGNREVVLDRGDASARHEGGIVTPVVTRDEQLAHAVQTQDPVVEAQLEPVRVPAGERFDGALAFFAPTTSFRDVRSIDVRVDGSMQPLRGQYFTLDEKRTIDQARRN
jgi:hypothetical protein